MVDNLLIDYLRTREIKQKAIYSQKYELAANKRDEERKLSVKLYESLAGDKVDNFDWVKFEQSVDNYCIKEYGFSIKESCLLKQVIRQKKLKDLGV